MFDKDITIVNKKFNKTTKSDEYVLTNLKAFWSENEGMSINGTSMVKNGSTIVRILLKDSNYITPMEFNSGIDGWTIQNDDYIVKGKIDSITTLTKLKENNVCIKVTNVAVKDYGSSNMQHIEISGE